MNFVESLVERLRPLVSLKGWDYCVLWKLAEDQRFIEWMGCCCGGTQSTQNGGEELLFHVSPVHPCRDIMFQHPRTRACDLLSELPLPSSLPLDPGIYVDTLLSNQPRWMNLSNSSSINASDGTMGTRVLIPVTGGLIELFVVKQIPEDQEIIDFVMAQCNAQWELQGPAKADDGGPIDLQSSKLCHANGFSPKDSINPYPPWVSPTGMTDNLNLPWELPPEQSCLYSSPMDFFGAGSGRPFPPDNRPKDDIFFENSMENGFQDINVALQQPLVTSATDTHPPIQEFSVNNEAAHDKDSNEPETGNTNSVSDCSDQIEEGDEQKGRRPQSKNLDAERKRRKKLNERLYELRALVPKISKMDRASILGDAIEFVKELQKKVKDLQDELEEPMEEDRSKITDGNNNLDISHQNGQNHEFDEYMNKSTLGMIEHGTRCSSTIKITEAPLVEVTHIGAKEFYVRVFCEQKAGGFVKLMEAMNAMGLEVMNLNVITFRKLVLNIFKVEKRDDEKVQAEHVRESLLEITRNPIGSWPERLRIMWPKLKSSQPGGGPSSEQVNSVRSKLNVNEEYMEAFRTKSYIEMSSKVQASSNEESSSSSSSSFPSYTHLCDHLLEPNQEILMDMIEHCSEPDQQLRRLLIDYFECSLEACKICGFLLQSIHQTRTDYSKIQRIINFSKNLATEDRCGFIFNELASFAKLANPLSCSSSVQFHLIHDRYELMLNQLTLTRKKKKRKVKLIRFCKKAAGISLVITCITVAAATLILAAHTLVGILASPAVLGISLGILKRRIESIRMGFNTTVICREREQLDAAAKGVYILNRDFDTVNRLAMRLHDEIDHRKKMAKMCVRSQNRQMLMVVVREFKSNESGFLEQVRELEEHVYLCLLTINRARRLVLQEIMVRPQENA
ncbi:hypothetical protein NE237_017611 [Protea cynaroides]|uniref:BHLH domain-containing protein n=1 Tax=Protea cynaroides TaxID=273540 RepID=A0A9Q0K8D2_9MAGN|nr:hypothetical protein NE237_017611 [Protea cynaroides]